MKAAFPDVPAYLVKCKHILDTQFREPLVMEDIASEIGVSSCHLCHAFSVHFQISPYAYLTDLRIEESCRLLRNTYMSVKQIAASVGFSTSSRFCASFRRNMGVTPNDYRHGADR